MAKVAFLQDIWHEQLGIGYLAGYLKHRGVESVLLIGRDEHDLLPRLLAEKPTLAAFSSTTGSHRWALRMARAVKRVADIPVVMGGAHATFFPDVLAEEGLDLIVRGEGEAALLEVVEAIDTGGDVARIRNVWAKKNGQRFKTEPRPLARDLDGLPFPDRSLFDQYGMFRKDTVRPVLTSRGCPFDCSYCFNASYRELYAGKGKTLRLRSVENCIAEVKDLTQRYALRLVNFVDDVFGLNRRWLRDFLPRYGREVGVPFLCNSRWELLDEGTVRGLKDAGCWAVQVGLESGNERLRRSVLRRGASNSLIVERAGLLKKHGLPFRTYNMVGLPGESLDDAFQTMQFNAQIGTNFPYVALFQPYPGTALGERAAPKGNGAADDQRDLPVTFHKRSVLRQKDIRKVENLHKLFLPVIRFPRAKRLWQWLVSWPANPFFEAVFLLSTGLTYARLTRRRLRDVIRVGFRNIRYYLEI